MHPQLSVDWRQYRTEDGRIGSLIGSLDDLGVAHRKLVAEIVMIRMFLLTENTVASVCSKLVCGANYLDGTAPRTLISASSSTSAQKLMRTQGRTRAKSFLKWASCRDIRDNLRHTVQSVDPVFGVISNHSARMDEMRYVRNHIAHRSRSTQSQFREIVVNYYGALRRGMTPGLLLLTPALGPPLLLDKYLTFNRIFIRELVRA